MGEISLNNQPYTPHITTQSSLFQLIKEIEDQYDFSEHIVHLFLNDTIANFQENPDLVDQSLDSFNKISLAITPLAEFMQTTFAAQIKLIQDTIELIHLILDQWEKDETNLAWINFTQLIENLQFFLSETINTLHIIQDHPTLSPTKLGLDHVLLVDTLLITLKDLLAAQERADSVYMSDLLRVDLVAILEKWRTEYWLPLANCS